MKDSVSENGGSIGNDWSEYRPLSETGEASDSGDEFGDAYSQDLQMESYGLTKPKPVPKKPAGKPKRGGLLGGKILPGILRK